MSDIFAHFDDDVRDAPIIVTTSNFTAEPGRMTDPVQIRQFIRAGKAKLTLRSAKTGTRFTYKIGVSEDGAAHFVSVLNGPDNFSNYKYIGRIAREVFWAGRKTPRHGDISPDAPSVRAFAWAWQQLVRGNLPDALEVWHEGCCGRCGRALTVPESIASGFGPECITKLND